MIWARTLLSVIVGSHVTTTPSENVREPSTVAASGNMPEIYGSEEQRRLPVAQFDVQDRPSRRSCGVSQGSGDRAAQDRCSPARARSDAATSGLSATLAPRLVSTGLLTWDDQH
jgi:hypothetical protein